MKKLIKTAVIIFLLLAAGVSAQNKSTAKLDRIIKKDYQVIECSISKMSDTSVEYSLPGETMVISLEINRIARIDFAGGRSQAFDTASGTGTAAGPPASQAVENAPAKTNTIAVLPVPYVNSDNLQSSEEMARFAQNDIYNKLIDKSSNIFPLTVQDLRVTNSLLHKAGISSANIDDTPIEDLQKILGADNIVAAKISYTITQGQTTSTYSSGTAKANDTYTKGKTNSSSVTTASTQEYYHYTVYFDMYKNGTKIYTQSRKPFLNLKDSWIDSITYLLKRSPIYVK
jgi:hypothetical protein